MKVTPLSAVPTMPKATSAQWLLRLPMKNDSLSAPRVVRQATAKSRPKQAEAGQDDKKQERWRNRRLWQFGWPGYLKPTACAAAVATCSYTSATECPPCGCTRLESIT